ncbi:hypothetical protein ACOME3_010558 [Neoechinorhynchus agilis]
MSLSQARNFQIKHFPDLKLVLVDEKCSPVRFALLTGNELYSLQKQFRGCQKKRAGDVGGSSYKIIYLKGNIAMADLNCKLQSLNVRSKYRIEIKDKDGDIKDVLERVKSFLDEKEVKFSICKDENTHVILLTK